MRPVVRDPAVDLGCLGRGERGLLGVWGDSVPQILNIEDAFRRGHVVEGGFHLRIVVADVSDRQILCASDAVIRQRCTEITHITVHEVLDRSGYRQLGRIMFSGVDLGAFIEPDVDDGDDNDNEEGEGDGDDDEESETLGDLARMDNGVTSAVLADAAVRWIKHMADQNMVGQRENKFKVNLWKGKGDKVIYSSRFLCTNTEYEEPAVAVPAPTVPLPGPNPDTSPDPRTWRALGEGYQNFIALVQSSYQHLANLQNAHITSTSGQLARTQRSNENIVGQLTNLKIGVFEAESSQRGDDGRVREELGKQFIAELGGPWRERQGLVKAGDRPIKRVIDLTKRSLPSLAAPGRLDDLVEAGLGDRGFRDRWTRPTERCLLARAADAPTGCSVAPDVARLAALPATGPMGETWTLLGASGPVHVVECVKAKDSQADVVRAQWLAEVAEGRVEALWIGSLLDSSFEARFTGPVRVARSTHVPASVPAWDVCGPWKSGDRGEGDESADACRIVVSPVAARGIDRGKAVRAITLVPSGTHWFGNFLEEPFAARSTWTQDGDSWRLTETWTWPGGKHPPLVETTRVTWNAARVAFTLARVEPCGNGDQARAVLYPDGPEAERCVRR